MTRMDAIRQLSDLTHAKLPPELHSRLERGMALVMHELITPDVDGGYKVLRSDGSGFHHVNGSCDCADYPRAPEGLCKHRMACGIYRKLQTLLPPPVDD